MTTDLYVCHCIFLGINPCVTLSRATINGTAKTKVAISPFFLCLIEFVKTSIAGDQTSESWIYLQNFKFEKNWREPLIAILKMLYFDRLEL